MGKNMMIERGYRGIRELCAGGTRDLSSGGCKTANGSLGSGTVKAFLARGPT